jgi:hypothetical protein
MYDKSLLEFLRSLRDLTDANIRFLEAQDVQFVLGEEYREELLKIQDLINSFSFVGPQPINKSLLEYPMPESIKEMFK